MIGIGIGGSIRDKNNPLFIDIATLLKGQEAPTGADTVLTPTASSGNTITVDTSAWSSIPSKFPIAVKYTDDSHGTYWVTATSGSDITVHETLEKEVATLKALHLDNTSIHLTDYGLRAMAEYIADYDKDFAYREYVSRRIRMTRAESLVYSNPNLYDENVGSEMAEITLIGGAGTGGYTPSGLLARNAGLSTVFSETMLFRPYYLLVQGGVVDRGMSIDIELYNSGYIELWAGTNTTYDPGRVSILDSGSNEVFTETFSGAAKRITAKLPKGTYSLRVLTTTTGDLSASISDITIFEARGRTGKIFNANSKVVFMMDSWGVYPIGGATVNRYDATDSGGACALPVHFSDYLGATSYIACRGGTTSAWGKHWVDTFIDDNSPTHVVFNFAINDKLSQGNVAGSTASSYDFGPDTPWQVLQSDSGGLFGSTSEDWWVENMTEICRKCFNKGVIPVLIMPPKTASGAASDGFQLLHDRLLSGIL